MKAHFIRCLKGLLLSLLCLLCLEHTYGQATKKPNPAKSIEIVMSTDGDLALNGVAEVSAVKTNKAQKPTQDKLVKQLGEPDEVKIFTTPDDARKSKNHEKLDIDIPDESVVSLRTQNGKVTLNDLQSSVTGYMKGGALALDNVKGKVEIVNEAGDIDARNVEANGSLTARRGNIRLTDVTGNVATFAPGGLITVVIGPKYHQKRAKPLSVELKKGNIEISEAPFGGSVRLGSGAIDIAKIDGPLTVEAESANITLQGLAAPLSLRNRGNVSVKLSKFADKKQEGGVVDIETIDGDVILEIAKNFTGSLDIWTTEHSPKAAVAPVTSTLTLGKASVADNGFGDGVVTIRETSYRVAVGKGGGPRVAVHVTNGKVIVKN